MADPRLVNYIKSQLSRGVSLEQIRQILISSGWPDYEISSATQWAAQQINPQARVSAPQMSSTPQIDSAINAFEREINSNTMQTTQTSQPYQQPVEKSSNLWILLALGIVFIVGGVVALLVLLIK